MLFSFEEAAWSLVASMLDQDLCPLSPCMLVEPLRNELRGLGMAFSREWRGRYNSARQQRKDVARNYGQPDYVAAGTKVFLLVDCLRPRARDMFELVHESMDSRRSKRLQPSALLGMTPGRRQAAQYAESNFSQILHLIVKPGSHSWCSYDH